ncbi:MAG: gamma-butyrobetaine hydroxylase-like domain-containing protein [Pirellulales bacterium]
MPDTLQPTKLEIRDGQLQIAWSDGQLRRYTFGELRNACPCATCREKRSLPPAPPPLLPILTAAEARPLAIAGMTPVGSYAYKIDFSDGHDTGIFTLAFLRELGTIVE